MNYTIIWSASTGPSDTITNTQTTPVNYTITVAKIANSDSLIYAEEFDRRQQSRFDTLRINGNGLFSKTSVGFWGYTSEIKFINDSLVIHTDEGTGAQGNIHNGSRFKCKKISN